MPYIKSDVVRTMRYSEVNASLVYRIIQLAQLNPSWWDKLLRDGELKAKTNPRYLSWFNEFNSLSDESVS